MDLTKSNYATKINDYFESYFRQDIFFQVFSSNKQLLVKYRFISNSGDYIYERTVKQKKRND